MSDSLRPHGLQGARLPCPSSPRACSNSCLLSQFLSSNHLILCHPLLLLPSIFPSIRVFSYKLALCISLPNYWSFNFSISPSSEYSGLISFRIDWFDLLYTVKWKFQNLREINLFGRYSVQFSSVTQSCLTLRSHEPQHTRPPCPSPTPRVHPNPCPLSQWCHPTISSSVIPFSFCPQSFPASGSFAMS